MSRRLLIFLVSLLTCLSVAAPAMAAEQGAWRGADPVGDVHASSFSPEPPPCGTWTEPEVAEGDIVRLDVRHRPGSVQLTARLAAATPVRELDVTFPLRTDRQRLEVNVWWRHGQADAEVWRPQRVSEDDLPEPDECGVSMFSTIAVGKPCRVEATMTERVIRVVVARDCLKNPRWVRAGVEVSGGSRDVYYSDRWGAAGDDTKWWIPTYGPRVRVSR